jgi:hypothetical protein
MQRQSNTQLPFETLMAGSRGVLEAATKWQEELMRFFGKRLSSYFEAASQLPQCRNPSDLLMLQTGFVRQMLSDYQAEAEWIGGQILQAEKPVQRQIDHAFESYEESILKAQRDAARIIDLAKDQAARIVDSAEAQSSRKTAEHSARRNRKAANG